MASNVEIRITAKDSASKEIKNLQTELGGLGKSATGLSKELNSSNSSVEKFSAGFASMAKSVSIGAGIIAAAGITFKKAMDFGEQGAAVAQTEMSFNSLIQTIGADADLMDKLRIASKGTVSELTLMSATATLLAGTSKELGKELADNAPQILEIAKAANKLNPTLGSTEFLYESLMKGIKRGSPMLIDNTGLIVKLGEANETLAASLGKSVEQLTAEEQKVALMNAVMEAGNNLIQQVGGNTDSMTDSFARLDAATTNLSNSIKKKLAPGLADVAEAATEMLTYSNETSKKMGELERNIRMTSGSYEQYFQQLKKVSKEHDVSFFLMGMVSEEHYNESRALAAAAEARNMYNVGLQQTNQLNQVNIADQGFVQQAYIDGTAALQQYNSEMNALRTEIGMGMIGLENLSASLRTNTSSTGYAQAAVAQLNQAFQSGKITSIEYAKGLQGINTQFGLTTPKSDAMALGLTALNQAAIDGRLPWDDLGTVQEQWRTSVNSGQTDLETFLSKVGVDTPANMDKANTAIDENTQFYKVLNDEGISPVASSLAEIWSYDGRKVEMDVVVNYSGGGGGGGGGTSSYKPSFDNREGVTGGSSGMVWSGKAEGGNVSGGKTILVGERGPELFTPGSNGYITPNDKLGGVTLHVHYSPMISLASEHEIKNTLLPYVRDALRNV